ncbi:hypothetical protein D8674_003035 [Pyrus ussuriensis x Pyrus communis]|uniref:Uncharacterized protein n=1 Tax=Pyrus ussuriensis x Pyrus communis TaxID=2448454 RepID=A0A5N5FL63_9ROSA|nr:hypothetical protein D8674_003035 [Pyrus ussuriensis x Pyrus communis]
MNVVATRLSWAEPPLGREVVEYMLDHDSDMWSMSWSKANLFRLMNVVSGLVAMGRWVKLIRSWNRQVFSALVVALFLLLVAYPDLFIPMNLLYMALVGLGDIGLDRVNHPLAFPMLKVSMLMNWMWNSIRSQQAGARRW